MGAPSTDGLVLIDKPAGVTSHDAVQAVRRALGVKRAGHAGTLDPFATGLLVVLTGRATRLMPYVHGEPKRYDATIAFGTETDTDDVTGSVTREAGIPNEAILRDGIAALTGTLSQIPPAYSAKQIAGTRAYDAARQGKPLELAAVTVVVHDWEIREVTHADTGGVASLHVSIVCGGGTYIRALARDLGRLAGSAAHLSALRRVRSGDLDVADATPLPEIRAGRLTTRSPRLALGAMPAETLDTVSIASVMHGRAVGATVAGARAVLVDPDGAIIAIAERDGDVWHPRAVIAEATPGDRAAALRGATAEIDGDGPRAND